MVMAEVGCTKETAAQAFEDAEWHIPTALNILVNSVLMPFAEVEAVLIYNYFEMRPFAIIS